MAEREGRPQSLFAALDFLAMVNPHSNQFKPGAAPLAEAGQRYGSEMRLSAKTNKRFRR